MPVVRMRIGREVSIGRLTAKTDGAVIFVFRSLGGLAYSGDGQNIRPTKAKAYADARTMKGDQS